jgi:pimeloyl-ACP methyl ester carboxylesterase
MATFVLGHGGRHGGWCWKRVSPLLRAAGHDVYTPTYTGLGERKHLLSPSIDLTTHIQDVVGVLEYEDLAGVILVGHSYGGMVVTGVTDAVPDRIAHLVYLDAAIPEDGESLIDVLPAAQHLRELAETRGDGWRLPAEYASPASYDVTDPADAQWVASKLADQPFRCYTQPLQLRGNTSHVPRTFIYCTQSNSIPASCRERARSGPNWHYRELEAGHDAMVTAPAALTSLLLEIAGE